MTDYNPAPSAPRTTRSFKAMGEASVKRLLVVDDEETIRTPLSRFLRSRGYEVTTADSGAAALEQLERERFLLMLCDVRMPGMSGVEVVPKAAALDPDMAIMMLTAVNDAPTATEALMHGAMDYLMKPIELPDLEEAVERALHKRTLTMEQRNVERMIREEVASRTAELEREKQALRDLSVNIVETLVNAMEAKDIYLRGHSQRVADLGASIGEAMGLDEDTVERIRMAGLLHDVGKIGIRESILNKPAALTPEEFEHVKTHVRIGVDILTPLQHVAPVLEYVHHHHEHYDGSGYPQGLKGEAITIGGRILCAADAFDAMTSKRAYRGPMDQKETLGYLEKLRGKLVDPRVFDALRKVVEGQQTLVFIDDVHS
jgi:putative two-component system response regulator